MADEAVAKVRSCPHGRGAFALKNFKKNEHIAILENQRFTSSTNSKGYALRIAENLYWDEDLVRTPSSWTKHLDHSPDPNIHLIFYPEKNIVILEATRDIRTGEELFINYTEYYPVNYPSNPWSVESLQEE